VLPRTDPDPPHQSSSSPRRGLSGVRSWSGVPSLILVAVAFGVAQAVVLPHDTYPSWDEALYASQFSTSVPAMGLSAHRALGMPVLLAPVTVLTPSVTAIRTYLTVLTSAGLVLAFRPWLTVGGRSAVLAAALFAGSEVALVNAPQALPSMPAALAAVAGVGYFLQATGPRPRWSAPAGAVVAFAVLSLTRPTDAVFVAVPVLVAALAVRRWRRLPAAAAVMGGLLIGGGVWLAESWVRYGGPFSRLDAMRRITAAGTQPVALHWIHGLRAYAAGSPWPAVLVVAGCLGTAAVVTVLVARRRWTVPASPVWALPVAAALTAALPYYLLLSFTSDRYLLPAYGLATPVLAAALIRMTRIRSGRTGLLAGCVVAGLVTAFVAVQVPIARHDTALVAAARLEQRDYAARLRALGVAPPCVVSGSYAPQLAYTLGCSAEDIKSAVADHATERAANWRDLRTARKQHAQLVVVRSTGWRPPWLAGWTRVRLSPRDDAYAYFLPGRS
jgi:hypothetical protein